jgi:hypothetical protein
MASWPSACAGSWPPGIGSGRCCSLATSAARVDGERGQAVRNTPDGQALLEALRDARALFDDSKAAQKRQAIEQRISSAQVLGGRVRMVRQQLDGTTERMMEQMRRGYAL